MLKQYAIAEKSYQKALSIFLENKSFEPDDIKKLSAGIYHQLGRVAEEQRQWEQAENYYKQALQIKIDFNDRFSQASTYRQLGIVAQQQRQWEQARQYLLETLKISAEFSDQHVLSITLRTLARLWEDSGDKNLPAATAPILSSTPEEVTELLRGLLD